MLGQHALLNSQSALGSDSDDIMLHPDNVMAGCDQTALLLLQSPTLQQQRASTERTSM